MGKRMIRIRKFIRDSCSLGRKGTGMRNLSRQRKLRNFYEK